MRYFLGVHRFTPILAMVGDTGWLLGMYRRWVHIIRMWNRLILMEDNRITKKAFIVDYLRCNKNWSSDIKYIFSCLGLLSHFEHKLTVDMSHINQLMRHYYSGVWLADIGGIPKLRTYRLYKCSFGCEKYVSLNLEKYERSLLCQFRSGILPLRIETGRYVGETQDERLCKLCGGEQIEDECHFLFDCQLYDDLRANAFSDMFSINTNTSAAQRLAYMMTNQTRKLAKFIVRSYLQRRSKLFI